MMFAEVKGKKGFALEGSVCFHQARVSFFEERVCQDATLSSFSRLLVAWIREQKTSEAGEPSFPSVHKIRACIES